MINIVLSAYARQMEQYMNSFFHQPEGLVEVGAIGGQGEGEACKILISLLNIERETTMSITAAQGTTSGRYTGVSAPPVFVNLNVVIAAVFGDKRYKEALSFLSLAIAFVQTTPVFTTEDGTKYTIEVGSPSLQDQSNIWTLLGGRYYPSIVCKIRRLTFDANEMKQTITDIRARKASVTS